MTSVGKVLKLYRVKHNISQSELATSLSVSVNFLSQVENEKCSFSLSKLEEVAKKINLSKELLILISTSPPKEFTAKQNTAFLKMQEFLLQGLLI